MLIWVITSETSNHVVLDEPRPQNEHTNEKSTSSQWGHSVSDDAVNKIQQNDVSIAMQKQTQWCKTVWKEWDENM